LPRRSSPPSHSKADGSATSITPANTRANVYEVMASAAVAVAAVLTYYHALHYYFSQDDFTFLARAEGLLPYPGLTAPFGLRVLSTRLYFQMMYALFGLAPAPYHAASLILHATNAVLVFWAARLWTRSRTVALVAAFVFATFDIAFTAVFWASGVQDLLAVTFFLACALVWVSRVEKGPLISIASAFALLLSLLSKEIAILAPAVLALMAWAQRSRRRRAAAALIPHAALSVAALGLVLLHGGKTAPGSAYAAAISSDVFHNLATYVLWTADVTHPFRDMVAAIDYGAWRVALPLAAAAAALLLTWRGPRARMAWAAAGWYALTLAPVLPLLHHTYLYYLYPASAGAAIFAGLVIQRVAGAIAGDSAAARASETARPPGGATARRTLGALAAVVVTAALCVAGALDVRAREHTYLPPDYVIPYDHVLRAAALAQNAAAAFAQAPVPRGADLLLINPYAPETVDLTERSATAAGRSAPGRAGQGGRGDAGATGESGPGATGGARAGEPGGGTERQSAGQATQTRDMVRSALRDGEVFKVLRPDIGDVAFARRMDPRWERRYCLLYDANAGLTYLGTGADVWANLSTVYLLNVGDLEESMRCSRRALELRPDHPRANLNLGIALAMIGAEGQAREYLTRAAAAGHESIRAQARKWLNSIEQGGRQSQQGEK
jgi:tetratricopeptide (TPR) repeat protein